MVHRIGVMCTDKPEKVISHMVEIGGGGGMVLQTGEVVQGVM